MDNRPIPFDDLTPRVVSNVVSELDGAASVRAIQPAPERRWLSQIAGNEQAKLTYVGHAVKNPYNLMFLSGMAVASLISGSAALLMISLLVEVVALAVLPSQEFFRRHVNVRLAEDELVEAERQREQLLFQMNEEHRRELERLEFLVHRIRNNCGHQHEQVKVALHESLGLDRLLASYVRLGIAHRTSRETLAMTNRRELQGKIERLQVAVRTAPNGRMRRLHERRRAIAVTRAERWDRNRENLEVIAQQLATISDLIHMIHEQSMTPMDVQAINNDIDQFISGMEENEGTLRELAAELDDEIRTEGDYEHLEVEELDDEDLIASEEEDDRPVIDADRLRVSAQGAEAA